MRLPSWLTANRVAALSGALTGLAAFVSGLVQILPGVWPNYALTASGLLVKAATVVKYLHGSQNFDVLEAEKTLALFRATGDLPGETQGVKAQGFEPPQDPPPVQPAQQGPPAPSVQAQPPAAVPQA